MKYGRTLAGLLSVVVGCNPTSMGGLRMDDAGAVVDTGARSDGVVATTDLGSAPVQATATRGIFDREIMAAPGMSARILFRTEVTVINAGSDAPVRIGDNSFTLLTTDTREVESGNPQGYPWVRCQQRALLRGDRVTCTANFELEPGQVPRQILVADDMSRASIANVAVGPYDLAAELTPRGTCERLYWVPNISDCSACWFANCRAQQEAWNACTSGRPSSTGARWARFYCQQLEPWTLGMCRAETEARASCADTACAGPCAIWRP